MGFWGDLEVYDVCIECGNVDATYETNDARRSDALVVCARCAQSILPITLTEEKAR